jgi:predicted dehydrogenase
MAIRNWAVIGPGNIARDFARDLALVRPPQQVSAVVGHQQESVNSFADDFGVEKRYVEFSRFLEESPADAVYIATPHPQHFEQALQCLQKRLAVLCEKPMTINATQSRQLIETAVQYESFLMEGMWIRFLPSIRQVVSIISEGLIGDVITIKASMGYKAPKEPGSRYFEPALGGGSLLDLGIYPVFLACLLLGRPASIMARGVLSEKGIDESCSIKMEYSSGQKALLESTLLAQPDTPAEIIGEKGTIRILDPWFEKAAGIEVQLYRQGKIIYPCRWEGHGLQFETQEVVNCVEQNKIESDLMSHAFSLEVMEILDEIREQLNVTYEMYE